MNNSEITQHLKNVLPFSRLAELKRKQANELFHAKQYNEALAVYNEIICKYFGLCAYSTYKQKNFFNM